MSIMFWKKGEAEIVKDCKRFVAEVESRYAESGIGALNALEKVAKVVKAQILNEPHKVERYIKENQSNGVSPEVWVYSCFHNLSGDMLESGENMVYRGGLDSLGSGLLQIFDDTADHLVKIGSVDRDYCDRQKANIRKTIGGMG